MIGYYVHHRGSGHRHRALAIARALGEPVTGLSSAAAPDGWTGEWIELPLDTDVAPPVDPRAGERLHWVPKGSRGLRERMGILSAWLVDAQPEAVVVDVSVEVAALVRLHGIPVITVAQPGDRRDPAHQLGYDLSEAIIAPWPRGFDPLITSPGAAAKVRPVGTISRVDISPAPTTDRNGVVVLRGYGGTGEGPLERAVSDLRARGVEVADATGSSEQIAQSLRAASVVLSHCGQNAVAEIAATRTPAVLVADDRPHEEQRTFALALQRFGAPAVVFADAPSSDVDWSEAVRTSAALDGEGWSRFATGEGAETAAQVIREIARTEAQA